MLNHYRMCTVLLNLLPRKSEKQALFPCLSVSSSHSVCPTNSTVCAFEHWQACVLNSHVTQMWDRPQLSSSPSHWCPLEVTLLNMVVLNSLITSLPQEDRAVHNYQSICQAWPLWSLITSFFKFGSYLVLYIFYIFFTSNSIWVAKASPVRASISVGSF